jgi:hypothetical protein
MAANQWRPVAGPIQGCLPASLIIGRDPRRNRPTQAARAGQVVDPISVGQGSRAPKRAPTLVDSGGRIDFHLCRAARGVRDEIKCKLTGV